MDTYLHHIVITILLFFLHFFHSLWQGRLVQTLPVWHTYRFLLFTTLSNSHLPSNFLFYFLLVISLCMYTVRRSTRIGWISAVNCQNRASVLLLELFKGSKTNIFRIVILSFTVKNYPIWKSSFWNHIQIAWTFQDSDSSELLILKDKYFKFPVNLAISNAHRLTKNISLCIHFIFKSGISCYHYLKGVSHEIFYFILYFWKLNQYFLFRR